MAFTWRPPTDLKEKLQDKAKQMGIPLSNLLILICREYLQNQNPQEQKE